VAVGTGERYESLGVNAAAVAWFAAAPFWMKVE
jgi:hypothetical protein